jgi:NitT/TauT family transport system permease protein
MTVTDRAELASTTSSDSDGALRTTPRRQRTRWPIYRLGFQILLALALIAAWQWLPTIDWLSERYKFLNEFFISSPTEVARYVGSLFTGGEETAGVTVWPYLRTTITATILGVIIGLALGALAGLLFSNFRLVSEVVRPFIVLANSTPRIALIPIFVVIAGPNIRASILSVVVVVFFLGFFNAFEGGTKISQPILDNAKLLGATPIDIMRTIRLPQVLSWTFASVPNAISFGLIVAVATELIAGVRGMGTLLQTAMVNIDAGLTFAVIVILSVVGLGLYGVANVLRDVLLRWEKTD